MWFVCETPLKMSGYHKIGFRKASVINRPIEISWNSSDDVGNISSTEFCVNWKIEDGNLPDVMELVSKDLKGSISTPGLGSLPPPNYYKERHEYTAVIEVPPNIIEVIGDGALVVDIDIVPNIQSKSYVEVLTGEPRLDFNSRYMNWSAAEDFCVLNGGHLASLASYFHWQKMKDFFETNDLNNEIIWIGGKNKEGKENGFGVMEARYRKSSG